MLLGLLGDNYWGDNAAAVDSCVLCVRSFLVAAWAARAELAVAARGPVTVLELEGDLESEPCTWAWACSGACAGWQCRWGCFVWVLGNGSVRSATRAGNQMLWCSAKRAYVGFTGHVVVLSAHSR